MKHTRFSTKTFRKSLLVGIGIFLVYIVITGTTTIINNVDKKTTKIQDYQKITNYFGGLDSPKTFLILFENNAESRYGGGFVGSVGLVHVNHGQVKSDPIKSVYSYDYVVTQDPNYYTETDSNGYKVSYSLRDGIQNLDWPTNARREAAIFNKESGQNVDGVIAITPEILRTLLRNTGPIYLDDYKKTITADNILDSIQLEVESGTDKQQRKDPKTILSSVANQLLAKLTQKNISELQSFVPQFQDLLRSHQILLFAKDESVQQSIVKLGYDGGLIQFGGDFFMTAEQNIVAEKSSTFIDRSLARHIKIIADGTVTVDVTFKRTHTSDFQYQYVDPATGGQAWLVAANTSNVKVALPAGSKITSQAENTQIKLEGSEKFYDVYTFSTQVQPLQTGEYGFSYTLPAKQFMDNTLNFKSYLQATNGGFNTNITTTVEAPNGYVLMATNKNNLTQLNPSTIVYNINSDQDQFLSLVYAKQE